eukprot:767101-Hanusia_phi.AAC.1
MVRFFQENGFSKKARALCEELGIEDWNLQDLEYLTEESLDDLTETKLRMHEKKKLWNVISEKVRELSVSTARLLSPADLSDASTLSDSSGSEASDSEDDISEDEVVAARNTGDREDFELHLTCFLRSFGSFSGDHRISPDRMMQVMQIERDGEEPREWTMCMLLWLKLVRDASMDEDWREIWQESLSSPSQDKLLRTLDKILRRGEVTCKYWDTAKLAARGCRKQLVSVIFVTDELVRAHLSADSSIRGSWGRRVMSGWYGNTEDAGQVLERMNKFLWAQVEATQVITDVIDTGSYVCYMSMHKIACLLLFEYLETCKKHKTETMSAESGSDRSMSGKLEGFSMFASSSGKVFCVQPTPHRLAEISRNLRVLARLPGRLLLLLGPARSAGGLLGEEGRTMLTEHQEEKAKACQEAMARRQGVHLRGPAGTGKTFMALHLMLRELAKDSSCSVLFLLRSEGFVYFIARWVSSMARWKLVDEGLFDRIFFSFRGERGWDGPFWMTEGDGELRRQERKVELLLEDASEYKYVVIDEAHHVFSDEEATEYIRSKHYDQATMLLMSDSSQADVRSVAYPEGLQAVDLTDVVRNSQRTMTASLVFQRGIAAAQVSCHHNIAGRPVRPFVFASSSGDEGSCGAGEYVAHVVAAVKEATAEFADLDRKMAILVDERL